MRIAMIGLGRMGANMTRRLLRGGHEIVAYDPSKEAVSAVVSGIASVEDVDMAITAGPGLRWAVMGPHMTFHLGGGEGGMTHLLELLRPSFAAWWATMTTPELTDAVCQQIIDGVAAEAHGRSIAELARERDAILLPLLELVAERDR